MKEYEDAISAQRATYERDGVTGEKESYNEAECSGTQRKESGACSLGNLEVQNMQGNERQD